MLMTSVYMPRVPRQLTSFTATPITTTLLFAGSQISHSKKFVLFVRKPTRAPNRYSFPFFHLHKWLFSGELYDPYNE
jgi:hypothetical protein